MRKFTEEHKRKISEALMGHPVTDAVREKFSVYSKTKFHGTGVRRIFNNLVKIIELERWHNQIK